MDEVAAEVYAWLIVFQWAKRNNWHDFALVTDSSVVLQAFSTERYPNWKCIPWFSTAIKLKHNFSNVSMQSINRTHLAFVDSLANSARCSESDKLSPLHTIQRINPLNR
uniref:RNase H type-1 domain-containing protein n=1 Tax=Cannabis sativa TaxID=3483 RepID=A0A803PV35_CANSA